MYYVFELWNFQCYMSVVETWAKLNKLDKFINWDKIMFPARIVMNTWLNFAILRFLDKKCRPFFFISLEMFLKKKIIKERASGNMGTNGPKS